jgi:hypothetical protein
MLTLPVHSEHTLAVGDSSDPWLDPARLAKENVHESRSVVSYYVPPQRISYLSFAGKPEYTETVQESDNEDPTEPSSMIDA